MGKRMLFNKFILTLQWNLKQTFKSFNEYVICMGFIFIFNFPKPKNSFLKKNSFLVIVTYWGD